MIEIYTDGGCRNNPGLGAWAFLIVADDKIIHQQSGIKPHTTNNEMELTAILKALEAINPMMPPRDVVVYSDSQYSINAITKWFPKWVTTNQLKDKKNVKLIRDIWSNMINNIVTFQWLRGHSTNPFNNLADHLVNQAMDSYLNSATSQPPSL